ncbi:hypothetical protein [Nocardioides sp.]|uniref:hypothetical protein n=1 Tax=Nocardioides sp. TaxID=35761 RepID=UPI002B8D5EE5|nr:hypothetical protein [Nocardioides sp.]HXH77189.1 hypothetical protein [Nocardioides sp.]
MTRSRQRTWLERSLVTLAILAAFGAAYASFVALVIRALEQCAGYDDEGIMLAPKSLRGRVVCSGPGSETGLLVFYWSPPLLLLALALLVWLRSRHVVGFLATLVLAALSPLIAEAMVRAMPADCSADQRQQYGEEGCDRDRELR